MEEFGTRHRLQHWLHMSVVGKWRRCHDCISTLSPSSKISASSFFLCAVSFVFFPPSFFRSFFVFCPSYFLSFLSLNFHSFLCSFFCYFFFTFTFSFLLFCSFSCFFPSSFSSLFFFFFLGLASFFSSCFLCL